MAKRLGYRDLKVWQKGMDLVVMVYEISRKLPPDERFGLVAQIRRAAISIPANIAEGHGRFHRRDFAHHASIANGSVREVETHLEAALRIGYLVAADIAAALALTDELGRMLSRLVSRLLSPSPLSSLAL